MTLRVGSAGYVAIKITKVDAADVPAADPTPEPRHYEPSQGSTVRGQRISIPLNDDGKVDLDKLRGETRSRLAAALDDPTAKSVLFGIENEPLFTAQDVATLYAGMSQIEQLIFRLTLKIPADIASTAFTYSPKDLEMLTPPTQGVVNKYVPGKIAQHKDLIALALIFAGITRRQFELAIQLTAQRRAEQAQKVTPIVAEQAS